MKLYLCVMPVTLQRVFESGVWALKDLPQGDQEVAADMQVGESLVLPSGIRATLIHKQ